MGDEQSQSQSLGDELWDSWNLRACLIISLSLQFCLLFAASLRKICKSNFIHLFIWLAYTLSNWIAAYGLGQTVRKPTRNLLDPNKSGDLYMFWAQFLLLHLAGPDSITTFSTGDSGVWLKSLTGLISQVLATIYSFILVAISRKDKLWFPTILVFGVGLIKSWERVIALLNAGFDQFGETLLPKPDPGCDYEEAVSTYSATRGVQVEMEPHKKMASNYNNEQEILLGRDEKMDELKVLKSAHYFFEKFKILFTGSFLSYQTRETSRDYFLRCRNSTVAFRLIEYELSFLHDLMHTKMSVLQNMFGYILRIVCFSSVSVASVLFLLTDKRGYTGFDVGLTEALLLGTILFDVISIIMLLFSEWGILRISLVRYFTPSCIWKRKRWSRSVFQYNMLNYSSSNWFTQVVYKVSRFLLTLTGSVEKMRAMMSSSLVTVTKEKEDFIFNKLKMLSSKVKDLKVAKEACSQRGLLALLQHSRSYSKLEWSIREFQYLESLLIWHLATELCYHNLSEEEQKTNEYVGISQLLSNYMFYQLVVQPTLLSQEMGNFCIVLQDTQAETRKFFMKHSISNHKEACEKLRLVKTPYRAAVVKGTKSKSLLFDACILSKELRNLEEQQWELMAQVWVELMSYAAINCSPATHAQQPSKGGELLSFTWLLMYHLGLGTQFSDQVPHG
ncbi:hypothetical protein CsatA_002727 [Cannabis sativa]